MTADSLVAIDVNPGGRSTRGHLGVAEIVGDQVAAVFELDFTWPPGRLHDGRVGDSSEFRTAWAFVEAFIDGRPVVSFGADYDASALRRLLTQAGLEPPPLRVACVWGLALGAGFAGSVWRVAVAQGWVTDAEVRALRDAPGSKQRIAAGEDARACALVLVGLARRAGCSAGELVSRRGVRVRAL